VWTIGSLIRPLACRIIDNPAVRLIGPLVVDSIVVSVHRLAVSSINPPCGRLARWSSIRLLHSRLARRVVDRLANSSVGLLYRRLARRMVDWPAGGRSACCTVNWLAVWLIGLLRRRLARRVVDLPAVFVGLLAVWLIGLQGGQFTRRLSIHSPCGRFAGRVIDLPAASSIRSPCCHWTIRGCLGCCRCWVRW